MTPEEKLQQARAKHGRTFRCDVKVHRVTPASRHLIELQRRSQPVLIIVKAKQ